MNFSTTFNSILNPNQKSPMHEEEKILMQKIKAKHKLEAHTLIEYEFKQQLLQKEQEERLLGEKIDEDQDKKDAIRRKKMRDLEDRKRELLKNQEEIANQMKMEEKKESENNNIKQENSVIIKNEECKNEENISPENNNKEIETKKESEKDNKKNNNSSPNKFLGVSKTEALEYIEQSIKQIVEEMKRIHQEELEEKLKKKEFLKREEEYKRKKEEFRQQCEKKYQEEREKALDRKRILEDRERERQEHLEEKRIKKIKQNEKIKKMHKIRFENTQIKLEEKLKNEADMFNKKQIMSEEKRNKLEELRNIALKKKVLLHIKKQEEIQKFFDKNKEIHEMKFFEFQKRMEEIDKFKKNINKNRDEEIKNRIYDIKIKSIKSLQSRNIQEKEEDKKKKEIIYRMNNYFYKSQHKKEVNEREQMFKHEKMTLKRNEVVKNLQRIENVKEAKLLLERDKIEENYQKMEEFQLQKLLLAEKKRLLAIEVSKQRKKVLDKLDDFMNRNKDITPDMVKELYPEDKDLLEKIQKITESTQTYKNLYRSTSHVCNATLKKLGEQTLNDFSKYKTNMSFRSSNNQLGNSKMMSNTRGFSVTNFSNFNAMNKTSNNKLSLEPLSEKKLNKEFCQEFSEGEEEEFNSKLSKKHISDKMNIKNLGTDNDKEKNIFEENKNENCSEKINSEKDDKINNEMIDFNNNDKNNISSVKERFIINNYNHYDPSSKFDSRNSLNFYSIKNGLNYNNNNENNSKFQNKYSSQKTVEPLATTWNKPLSNIQIPIIGGSTKNQKNTNLNTNTKTNNLYNFNAVFDDKVKKKIIEKDIEKKLESYKIKLNSDMIKILKEEKQKEEEREMLYSKANSELEKRRLESLIALERVQSSERIIKLNEENDKKLREYEAKLKIKLKDIPS